MAEEDYFPIADEYYSDSEEDVDQEIKIPDIGDEYRGLVAPITEDDVKARRKLLRERRAKRVTDIPEEQMAQITSAYRSIYGKDPKSLLLRQPHTAEDYNEYGDLRRVNVFDRTAQRKREAENRKTDLRKEIARITGRKDLEGWEMDQIAAVARRQNAAANKARNRAIRAAMRQQGILPKIPEKGTEEYNKLIEDKKQKKYRSRVHQYYPRFITDRTLQPYLEKPEYRGDKTYDDPVYDDFVDSRSGLPVFTNWIGRTPQQLNVEERNRAAMLFGEMSGLLGLHPKYDRRFLTAASAKIALNDPNGKHYTYEMVDMDRDKRSPGTLIVRRKDNKQIIAIDGYLLNDAKESSEVQRLRDMIYFTENPNPGQRKKNPKSEFMREKKLMKTKKSTGLKRVKEYIEDCIKAIYKVTPPKSEYKPAQRKRIQTPIYIELEIDMPSQDVDPVPYSSSSRSLPPSRTTYVRGVINTYSVPLIAWRSIISSVAELFANMYVYPLIPFEQIGLAKFKPAFLASVFNQLKETALTATDFYAKWMQTYTDDAVLAYVLGNKYVQYYIENIITGYETGGINDALINNLQALINVACLFHMNGIEYIMKILNVGTFANLLKLNPVYRFVQTTKNPVFDTLTSRSWDKVVQQWGVISIGKELVSSLHREDVEHLEYDPLARQSTLRSYGYYGDNSAPRRKKQRRMQNNPDDNLSDDSSDDESVIEVSQDEQPKSSSSSSGDALLSTPVMTSTQTVQQQQPMQQQLNIGAQPFQSRQRDFFKRS